MYSFKNNIDTYQENRTFLSRSYEAKNDFVKQYIKSYREKEKSKQLYLQVLCELKVTIFEGNLKNFKNLSNIFSYIIDSINLEELSSYCGEDIYPFKKSNIIILACEYNRLEILKHIFLNYSVIYKHLFKNEKRIVLPDDEDENLHNAFYYSIRAGNTELLDTLINKWPDNYFNTHSDELDMILSKAYDELKLKNVLLSETIEVFVEEKLINLRFFSTKPTNVQNSKISVLNISERIEFLIEQITSLKSISQVNEEFLFLLKHIIQNINTLKRLIKITYSKIPWEEIEFCLVCFVLSFKQPKEINLFYRAALNKNKIFKHLTNFATGLESIKYEIKEYKVNALSVLPKISRKLNTSQIIKLNPDYEALYKDYQKICDINTLHTISTYIKLASLADAKKKEGQLVISRSLQVIGECLKDTLESPNLSSYMSNLLLLTLPKHTRKVVIDLRNSLSHAHSLSKRIEIQQNAKVSFFQGVQNDIKKIGNVINDIFFENKLKTVKDILESIVSSDDLKEVEEIISIFNVEELDKLLPDNLHLEECKKFLEIVEKLKDTISSKTQEEEKIFEKMDEIIKVQSNKLVNKMDKYTYGISELSFFNKTLNRRIDEQTLRTIKFVCKNALDKVINNTVKPQTLKSLAEMAFKLMLINQMKIECDNLDEIKTLVFEIICIAEIQMDNVQWVNELREKLSEKKNADQYLVKNYAMKDEYTNQLAFKLLDLKSILKNNKLNDLSSIPSVKNNGKLIAALEMLILDILSILGQLENRLEDNYFFLDQSIPYLIGKNLRNHLAHYNSVTDILPSDPAVILILNAQMLAEKLETMSGKIGKIVEEDPTKWKSEISRQLKVISLKKKMFDALEAGDFQTLKDCIAQGADIHSRSSDDWTTLHAAAKGGNVNIVKFLVEQKVNVDVKSSIKQNPLHVAAANGSSNVLEYFIKQKYYNLEDADDARRTPLHLAAMNNQKSSIEILLKHKANTTTKDRLGESPLHHAVEQNHLDAVQVLLKNEKSVDGNERLGGFTPLHLAAEEGCLEVVNFLLSRGANVNATSDGKALPLHFAALNGHTEIVEILVAKKSDINTRTWDGCTPLLYATENNHAKISEILLENGANPNIFAKIQNFGPIHHTTKNGQIEILKTLLKHNADANVITSDGKSPLDYAIGFGQLEIVKILHDHGVSMRGGKACSALHFAVKYGHLDIVQYLIDQKVDVNATDVNGSTPLHYAASEGRDDIVSLLIKNNANVNAKKPNTGYTPLFEALCECIQKVEDMSYEIRRILQRVCIFQMPNKEGKPSQRQYEKVIEVLLENGADVNAKTEAGTTPLHFAAAGGKCSIISMILKKNVLVNQKCDEGFNPLHVAAMFGHKQAVELLLANKAKINTLSSFNYSALHLAVEFGHKNVVKSLLANNANINEKTTEGLTPAAITVKSDRAEILEMLIDYGADVHVNAEKNIMIAILKGSGEVLKILLKSTMMKNNTDSISELLHFAIARSNMDAVNALIAHGIDVNKRLGDKPPPLLHAVALGQEKTVEILLENGADINCVMELERLTPLHVAAMVDNVELVEILLKHGANVNARDKKNSTALHLAIASGFLQIVKLLFPLVKVNVNEKGTNDFTLLHIAAQGGSLEVVQFLIEKGADPHIRTDDDDKPIHVAIKYGHLEIVKYFIDKGMDVRGELCPYKRSLLHYAALSNRTEIAEYLIQMGADVNARDADGIAPLYMSADIASAEFITVLLKNGAMYNLGRPLEICDDEAMRHILFLAEILFQSVKQNNLLQVNTCIKSGAIVNVRNSENVTPLHFAAWKGYEAIVEVLLQNKADPNSIGKKGFTPLHYAAKFGHLKVCMALLSNGAIYNVAGENGKTPLDLSEKKEVIELLKLIHSCFQKVLNKNTKVIADIKRLKDVSMVKTVMSACNGEGKTLIATAVLHEFPKVDELKEVLQNDLTEALKAAESFCAIEDFDTALTIYQKALEIRTEILGKNNLGTLDVQSDIAKVLYKQQKYDEALKIYTEVYEQQKSLLGEDSKEALNTRSNSALILHRLGKHDEAIEIFEDVYEKQKKISTLDDRDLLSTLLHTAAVLISLGRNEEALKINTTVFEHRKKKLGVNHSETLVMQNNIAMVLNNLGRHEEALKLFRKVYEARKRVIGLNHSDTLRTFHNLISVLKAQNKNAEAMDAYKDLLKTQEAQLGPDHRDTLNTQQSMAMLYMQQGKCISALKMFNRYLPRSRLKLGPTHPDVVYVEKTVQAIKDSFRRGGFPEIIDVINNLNNEARTAASSGDMSTLKFLIQNDLDVNEPDGEGRTLLHYACDNGQVNVALLLLDSGANATKATNKGNTPLHIAALKGREEMAKLLLGRVPRDAQVQYVNARTTAGGNAALHVAAKAGHYEIVRMLLVHGASFDVRNKEGKTPMELSQSYKVIQLLETIEAMFENAKTGDSEVVRKMQNAEREQLIVYVNMRNRLDKTLVQVAILHKHQEIAKEMLAAMKKLS